MPSPGTQSLTAETPRVVDNWITSSGSWPTGVAENDPHARERLVLLFGPLVISWCRRAGLTESAAAVVAHKVFASIADEEHPTEPFRDWLRVLTERSIRHHAEKLPDTQAIDASVSQLSSDTREERLALMRRAMDLVQLEFSPLDWQAFLATVFEQRSTLEVAAELRLAPLDVCKARARVLHRLRTELGDLGDPV